MVEPIMYLAIGFLVSMLFGLMIVPLVHNRAVRLTTKRLEAATPLSMAEIQADKDQLRAEFAMSTRRLEMSVDQLKNKTTSQLAELGKKTDAINRLKIELGEKSATIFALEARSRRGVRVDVFAQVDAARELLGFTPELRLEGPIDSAVPEATANHLLSTLYGALSNIAHHANASSVDVSVEAGEELRLRVVDDGIVTSAGVASGIDMAFHVVETLFGRDVADETAHYIEYRRDGKPALRV